MCAVDYCATGTMEGQAMVTRKVLAGVAAVGLVFGSTAATAAAAPVGDARIGSPVAAAEGIGTWGWLLALLIALGLIAVIASDNGEDLPGSP